MFIKINCYSPASCSECGSYVGSSYWHTHTTCSYCGQKQKPIVNDSSTARTQKMKGLFAIRQSFSNTLLPIAFFQSVEEVGGDGWTDEKLAAMGKMFARPCPRRPRHGFVDSRIVTTKEELEGVVKETLAEDEKGEVMLMEYHPSLFNAVWTPSMLTLGKGNDGATCGTNTLNVPLNGINPLSPQLLKTAHIGEEEDPYLEMVMGVDYKAMITQLRAGPKGSASPDYIPLTLQVGEVITVDHASSLLEWEKRIKLMEGKVGVVVNNLGGSPVDHFSVHARTYSIPVITTRKVEVGEVLEKIEGAAPPSPAAVLKGIMAAERVPLGSSHPNGYGDSQLAVILMLMGLHNSPVMGGEDGMWIGAAAAMMMRLGACALKGEARHISPNKGSRDSVYRRAFPYSLRRHRAALPRLIHTLRYGNFGGSSIGGRKWALCGAAVAELFNATARLAREQSPEAVGEVIRSLNSAVNQAHNGGWWMNKFAEMKLFKSMQEGDINSLLSITPLLMKVRETWDELPSTEVERKVEMWGKWGEVSLTPLRISAAEIQLIPGVGGLTFNIQDRVLKAKHKPIALSLDSLTSKLPLLLDGKLFIVPSPEGLKIELRRDMGKAPILLWEEEKLDPKEGKAI